MSGETLLTVQEHEAGTRLDKYLTAMTGLSRSAVQKQITAKNVTVNDVARPAHYALKAGDVVRVGEIISETPITRSATPVPTVIAEEKDFFVIEKPAGLLVHPADKSQESTLVDWLVRRDPNIVTVGELQRPGIVHRLDRNVSGLMVVARTPLMYTLLKEQFRTHQVVKMYTALVIGAPQRDEGTLTFRIARSARHGRMAARPSSAEGKDATTSFDVLQRFPTTTLLSVRILTGRTHQIRAHLFAAGFPVVGDSLYRSKKKVNLPPLDRLFLHASKLCFSDAGGVWRQYELPLPGELAGYLAMLEKHNTGRSV